MKYKRDTIDKKYIITRTGKPKGESSKFFIVPFGINTNIITIRIISIRPSKIFVVVIMIIMQMKRR